VKTFLTTLVFAIILSGCATATIGSEVVTAADKAKMASIIAARTEDDKARDTSRNPQQTLEFFGITSDMAIQKYWRPIWQKMENYTRLTMLMKSGQCLDFSAKNKLQQL